jgi:hypothetical protein
MRASGVLHCNIPLCAPHLPRGLWLPLERFRTGLAGLIEQSLPHLACEDRCPGSAALKKSLNCPFLCLMHVPMPEVNLNEGAQPVS